MYKDEALQKYLDAAASGESTPGGGSVCGLVGALGAALSSMVCNFTVGKKKYADVEEDVKAILARAEQLRATLTDLMQLDTEVYGKMAPAYSMPKDTDEQKAARTQAIQAGLKESLQVPRQIALAAKEVIELNEELVDKGNTMLVSDVGVAVLLARAAFEGAMMNVDINLAYIKDDAFCDQVRQELADPRNRTVPMAEKILEKVNANISS